MSPYVDRFQRKDLVVEIQSRELQRLGDILVLEFRLFSLQRLPVGMKRHCLDHAAHGEPHATDAGLPVHEGWVNSNAIKFPGHFGGLLQVG